MNQLNPKRLLGMSIGKKMSLLLACMIVISSCKTSRSVKDVLANREEPGVFTGPRKKAPNDAMVRPLFLQNKQIGIELPKTEGLQVDPETGAVIASEDVTYQHADNNTGYFDNSDLAVDTVYSLKEVTVEARSRFTPEHAGKVTVDFVVNVPKEVISNNWRITVQPSLIDEDSIVVLEPLLVKGRSFHNRQIADSIAYSEFEKSIIDPAAYDSVFLDHKGISQDIKRRQQFYYEKYYGDWNRQISYENWKQDFENKRESFIAKELGESNVLYHRYMRLANEEIMNELAYGRDTTGIRQAYMAEFAKKAKVKVSNWDDKSSLQKIPKQFEDIYEQGQTVDDLKVNRISAADSLKIAEHNYFFDKIAENEVKAARKAEKYKEIVPFPLEDSVRDIIIVDAGNTVKYLYKQTYPTRIGLKRVDIVIDSYVDAMDRSKYQFGTSDTLSYFVASMAQLVDMSLMSNETVVYRDVFNKMVSNLQFAPNSTNFDEFFGDNRKELDTFIDTYKTFTKEGGLAVDSIEMTVSTSLDGLYDRNVERTMKRSKSIKDFFGRKYRGLIDTTHVKAYYQGEDWNTLANLINKRTDMANKSEILEMMKTAVNPDQTELQIKRKYPRDYKVMYEELYPKLNKVEFVFNMHRPGMTDVKETKVEERPEYDKGVQLLLDRDYWAALEILSDYPDYNAALVLACLGYNAKSKELLESLEPNGYTEYLLAILSLRMGGDETSAIAHLKKACELDPSKVYRTQLDPEINGLVHKYNLDLNSSVAEVMVSGETEVAGEADATETVEATTEVTEEVEEATTDSATTTEMSETAEATETAE